MPPLEATQDAVQIIRAGTLAPLPAPGATQHVTGIGRLDTVAMYLEATTVADEITWRDRLAADGFAIAETIGHSGTVGDFGAQALRFSSSEHAIDFQRAALTADCARGVAQDVEPLDGVPAAVTYRMDQRDLASQRVSVVIGPFVVLLDLYPCRCSDDGMLVGNWARAVAEQLGAAHEP